MAATTKKNKKTPGTGPTEQLAYAEGRADARGGYPPQPPPKAGPAQDAYNRGYASVGTGKPKTDKGSRSAPRRSSGSARTPSRARRHPKSGGRARRRRPTSVGRAQRALTAPVNDQLVSGMTVIGLMIGLAVLLNVLRNAPAFAGVLAGAGKAVDWLDSPRSITYRPN